MIGKSLLGGLALCAALLVATTLAPEAKAQSTQEGVKVGMLTCNVGSGWGFIFGSSKELKCVFAPAGDKPSERYSGTIDKFGIDIGYTAAGVILWGVLAPTSDVGPGALAGTYGGVTAQATAGVGLGANVLLGGGNSISLQPVSISGQKGLNVAGGIAAVTLRAAR